MNDIDTNDFHATDARLRDWLVDSSRHVAGPDSPLIASTRSVNALARHLKINGQYLAWRLLSLESDGAIRRIRTGRAYPLVWELAA
jgi:hypothetical protein